MAPSSLTRMLRPRTFLHFISLLTATEFISLTLLINKVSGIYGILALFTGYHLSALQLSMYIWSILVFILVCYLGPHIRRQSPLQNLVLAWVYILDTIINAAYTALFGLGWFILLAQHLNPSNPDGSNSGMVGPGGKMINDTAGFTDPSAGKVDHVEVIAKPATDALPTGQEAIAFPKGDGSALGNVVFQSGSIMSITIISGLWLARLYCLVIVMSFARQTLRQTIAATCAAPAPHSAIPPSATSTHKSPIIPSPDDADDDAIDASTPALSHPGAPPADRNPFAAHLPLGQGFSGRLGRALIFPRAYWLGTDSLEEDIRLSRRARRTHRPHHKHVQQGARKEGRESIGLSPLRGPVLKNPPPPPQRGTGERERRARSGTGPPPPGLDVVSPRLGVASPRLSVGSPGLGFGFGRKSGEGERSD